VEKVDRNKKYAWKMRSFIKMELEIGQGEGGSNFEYEQKEFYKTRKGKE